jgi:hypothetical protein
MGAKPLTSTVPGKMPLTVNSRLRFCSLTTRARSACDKTRLSNSATRRTGAGVPGSGRGAAGRSNSSPRCSFRTVRRLGVGAAVVPGGEPGGTRPTPSLRPPSWSFYADVTTPDVAAAGLSVTRTLVPGTIANFPAGFPILGRRVAQDSAVRLGWRSEPMAEEDLTAIPLPHA